MKYKLIASDFDGTIYDGEKVDDRVKSAIAAYRAAGGKFCLATGRIFSSARQWVEPLGVDDEVIACQGAAVYHASTGEVIRKFPLEKSLAVRAAEFFEENGDVCHAYGDERFYLEKPNPLTTEYAGYCAVDPVYVGVPLSRHIPSMDAVNKVISIVSPDTIDDKIRTLRALLGDGAEVSKSSPIYLEITARDAGKGNALIALADYLGVPLEETIGVGDQLNDLSMVVTAGLGCAMGNGVPALKQAADIVIPSIGEGGVARLIEDVLHDRI